MPSEVPNGGLARIIAIAYLGANQMPERRISMFISKTKLLMAVLVVALVVPAAAYATDAWGDVPDAAYEHAAVTWAKANSITNGCDGGTNFCPAREVTRRENIAFIYRYDQEMVQPALADIQADADAAQADADTNAADIAAGDPFYVGIIELDGTQYPDNTGECTVGGPGCLFVDYLYWNTDVDLGDNDFVHFKHCNGSASTLPVCTDLSDGYIAQVTVMDQSSGSIDQDVVATTYFPSGGDAGELWIRLYDISLGAAQDDGVDIHLVIWKLP